MSYENLIYEKEDGIAKITINRPKVLNALNIAVLSELKAAVERAGNEDDVGTVVLTGAGRAFSAGVDLKSMDDPEPVGQDRGTIARALIEAIQVLPKVVIAMVNGYCITGALEIVLACDLIIASEEARFGDTHTRWGLKPVWGMSQRLPLAIGMLKAKELSFTAEIITAKDAERIGLVNKVVPAEKLEEAVRDMAGKIMANSLEAISVYKYLYNRSMTDRIKKGLELEVDNRLVISDTEERMLKFIKKD